MVLKVRAWPRSSSHHCGSTPCSDSHRVPVLSSLHANMHSFSWAGSPIPLFEDNIECLKPLLSHKRPSVRVWAQRCIDEYRSEIKREISQEEFMRMHYDR